MPYIRWEELYKQQAPLLLGICRRYVGDLQTAEDLMHDAFLVAIRKQESYSGNGAVEAWLRKIAVNTVLGYLRREKKLMEAAQAAMVFEAYPEIDDQEEETLQQRILNAGFGETELLEALDNLPEHHRTVFNLYVLENYTHSQIASELGISPGTSKSHLARARRKIQQYLLTNIQSMQFPSKRAGLLLLLIGKRPESTLDHVYRRTFARYRPLPPNAPPIALQEALAQSAPQAPWYAFHTGGKIIVGLLLTCTLAIAVAYPYLKPHSVSPAPKPAMERTGQPPGQNLPEVVSVPTHRVPEKTPERTAPPVLHQPKPAQKTPVIVRETIVLRDTVFHFIPEKHHEE